MAMLIMEMLWPAFVKLQVKNPWLETGFRMLTIKIRGDFSQACTKNDFGWSLKKGGCALGFLAPR